MANQKLIDKLKQLPRHHLILSTPHGFVDATSIAEIWGKENANRGFYWAGRGVNPARAFNREQAASFFEDGGLVYDQAAAWAATHAKEQ